MNTIADLRTDRLIARVVRILEREAADPDNEAWECDLLRDLRARAASLEDALEVWESHWASRRDRRP